MSNTDTRAQVSYALGHESELILNTTKGVFVPTATTNILIKAVMKRLSAPAKILDLGCGTGVVGLALCKYGLVNLPVYASDLSQTAVACCRENFSRYDYVVDARSGSLFEPWENMQFEVIVDDISGVAADVAKISPWFDGIPCDTGPGGTDLVVNILKNAAKHLAPGGSFFFPVLSLSNVDLLLETANCHFTSVELVERQEWPLPAELKKQLPLLESLAVKGFVKLHSRFGIQLGYTEVYCAKIN